jgi:uncharacterized protein YggE
VSVRDTNPDFLPTIFVKGRGRVEVEPDIAWVSLGVSVFHKKLKIAQDEAGTRMASLLTAIKSVGIADRDIKTQRFSVYPREEYHPETRAKLGISGYDVSNQARVTVRKLTAIGSLLEKAVDEGANTISGPNFGIRHPEKVESEARKQAILDAVRKANELAMVAGVEIGMVYRIEEEREHGRADGVYSSPRLMKESLSVPIEAGVLEVTCTVEITYTIEVGDRDTKL